MWLRDFLPANAALENTRILLYGYDSHIDGSSTSTDSISDYSRRLLTLLGQARNKPEVG
jgi:hypothetical protein